ncbi:MAG: hypothetical protein JKY81_01810 [Colwellia sp.]|nr:hypothetical protein [Colwellia sp.]
MGIETAIIGSAILGGVSSIASGNAQKSAARHQVAAAQQTSNQQIGLARETRDQQRADFEPFRQAELQRTNALSELFGFNAGGPQVSGGVAGQQALLGSTALSGGGASSAISAGQNYINTNPDVGRAFNSINSRDRQFVLDQGFDRDGDGQLSAAEFGDFHFNQHGRAEGRSGFEAGTTQVQQAAAPVAAPPPRGTPIAEVLPAGTVGALDPSVNPQIGEALGPTVDPSVRGAERFNESLFNAAFRADFGRDKDIIDQNLANQGVVFSGARLNAVEDSRQRNFSNALSNFTNTLSGFPTAGAGAQAGFAANSQFANSASNALGNFGAAQQQSAFNTGQANANTFAGLGSAAGTALGAFDFGGNNSVTRRF